MNNPQIPPALQKVPVDITPNAGSVTGTFGAMSISNLANGATGNSLTATAPIPSVSGTITSATLCPGSFNSGTGYFTLTSMTVTCGSAKVTLSTSGSCVTTSYFNGLPIPASCYAYFTGKCTSGGPCSKTMTGAYIALYY